MSEEEVPEHEREAELSLFREYRDVVGQFRYAVETDRRFYLANGVDVVPAAVKGAANTCEILLQDAWVWDIYRPNRFVKAARILTCKDVNIEELSSAELTLPDDLALES
ncbi:MAG: DUF2469 family protein [Microbacteriaceae bacterium]|nr:DUF2469 family protein [Microbacteriaceae bacterium]